MLTECPNVSRGATFGTGGGGGPNQLKSIGALTFILQTLRTTPSFGELFEYSASNIGTRIAKVVLCQSMNFEQF